MDESLCEKLVGGTVSGFRIERLLGSGGMGAVFLAEQVRLSRFVALKVLPPGGDSSVIERFEREAKILASLQHPAIVQVYDQFEAVGLYWIAMEYLRWGSAADLLKRSGPLAAWLAASIALPFASRAARRSTRIALSGRCVARSFTSTNCDGLRL